MTGILDRIEAHPKGRWIVVGLSALIVVTSGLMCGPTPEPRPTFAFSTDSSTGLIRSLTQPEPRGGAGHMKITAGTGDTRPTHFKFDTLTTTATYEPLMITTPVQSVVFVNSGKEILTITPEGKFILGPGATVDSAAMAIVLIAEQYMQHSPCRDSSTVHWDRLKAELVTERTCTCR